MSLSELFGNDIRGMHAKFHEFSMHKKKEI
jgi:hypothetical protein